MKPPVIFPLLLTLWVSLLLGACDQKSSSGNGFKQAAAKSYRQATFLDGTVSTGKSLIKTGTLVVTNEHGKMIAQTAVVNGRFKVEIPAGTKLPVILNFAPDNGGDKLIAAVINENVTRYYIDPSSTAIAIAAKAMGGYSHANLTRAAEATTHTPDANKTTTGWRGDPTSQYGGWH